MKVLLNGRLPQQGTELLRRHFGAGIELLLADGSDRDAGTLSAFAAAEVLVSTGFGAGDPAMPALRLIQVPGAGIDAVDLAAVPAGVAVCNVFEHEIGIAEYVLAAMLQHVVTLPARDARFRAGSWADSPHRGGAFRPELAGKTLGCVGYGHIGRAVGRRAKAFGMRIMAITQSSEPLEPAPDWSGRPDQLHDLLEAADFVLIACPLSANTEGLIDRAEFEHMQPQALLINVARGPIVAEDALYTALDQRKIAGAVIDAWYHYPSADTPDPRPSGQPFHELDNLIMTPHCSGWTEHLMARRFALISDNLERLQTGRPLLNQVFPTLSRAGPAHLARGPG